MSNNKLSIVVIFHNMRREARRTLHSLGADYQKSLDGAQYEVIAIDNGSAHPLSADEVREHGPNFRYEYFETGGVSPVDAVNAGVARASGQYVAVIVDGARMATPGLVARTQQALSMFPEPFVCALSWHLGPDIQGKSMLDGYDQQEEDRLLASIDWPQDGYRLFDVSSIAPSSAAGFLGGVPAECSWFAMSRDSFLQIGGFEPRFRSPGGGFVNHDFRNRALSIPGVSPIVILGEGVFHQFHGGVVTNAERKNVPSMMARFNEEYAAIREHGYEFKPAASATYLGGLPENARRFLGTA